MLRISRQFDAGNIEVVDAADVANVRLRIRPDTGSHFFQWFYFRVSGAHAQPLRLVIENAGAAAFVDGWQGYQALASFDRKYWFRIPTRYQDGALILEHCPERDVVWYAYFTPYSQERHQALIARAQCAAPCRVDSLGLSLQGRELDRVRVGDGPKQVWIIARQHPGETMAEWFMEGLLERLLDREDAVAERLLQRARLHLMPNMNPDGSFLGNLRTNAAGVNLNRVWGQADMEHSPEVYQVTQQLLESGCDLFLDIHGDEAIPANFIAGQDGAPVAAAILDREQAFKRNLRRVSPDFQLEQGYEPGRFGPETLTLASFWVGHHFGIPALTLEMPFKDNRVRPDPVQGWSAERSRQLGRDCLLPLLWELEG
ncbi:MAG TPA: M14-type cytosolic carboxypeptidase [Thiolinea sp.]|nr:M14-type cytosolic carboxypeptidase [Thiolinea sp.]